jgi:hypothetical protein
MGLIDRLFELLFGGGRNLVRETATIFRPDAEADAARTARLQAQAMAQHGAEYARPQRGAFDRFMDGLNRLPRPALALGTLGLFVSAMVDPLWFAARMQGIAMVPEPLWWLLGVIVSFYFGARHQAKAQSFQREIAGTMGHLPQVLENLDRIGTLRAARTGPDAGLRRAALAPGSNAALAEWQASRR